MQQIFLEIGSKTEVLVLEGGVKAFVELYGNDSRLVGRLPVEVVE